MSFSKFVVFTLVGRQTFLLLLPFIKSQGRIELVYIFIVHKQRLVIPASDLETFFIVTIISLWYVGCRVAACSWQKNFLASRFCCCCCVDAVILSVKQSHGHPHTHSKCSSFHLTHGTNYFINTAATQSEFFCPDHASTTCSPHTKEKE